MKSERILAIAEMVDRAASELAVVEVPGFMGSTALAVEKMVDAVNAICALHGRVAIAEKYSGEIREALEAKKMAKESAKDSEE